MRLSTWVLPAALSLAALSPVHAQVRASERASVSQTVDGTVFAIEYSRPRVRGRTLWGKTVEWGEIWTPGANWATTLEVNRDVTIDGHAVPKGKYSMWFVVRPERWTMILDPRWKRYHEDRPDSTAQQIRWTVMPKTGPLTESLTWSFPDVRPDGTTLLMQWGGTRVALDAVVHPSRPLTIARADAEPYLGAWTLTMYDDTTNTKGSVDQFELVYESGSMKLRFERGFAWYPRLQNATMVRFNDDWFVPTIMEGSRVFEAAADMIFEFTREGGRAVTIEIRDDHDTLIGRGTRR